MSIDIYWVEFILSLMGKNLHKSIMEVNNEKKSALVPSDLVKSLMGCILPSLILYYYYNYYQT